jgi:UDP-2-acetamido-3-amino-2,3-dideoxy-glucuronate N-acetyltransferase
MFIHPLSDVKSENIGENTRIWQFCVVYKDAAIGENCNICAHCLVEGHVQIGNNVTVKSGVFLCDGITLEDNVFVGSSVSFMNNEFPRSKEYKLYQKTLIRRNASIGCGAVILGGITIGENAMIGAGSVVTRDVPDNELWTGNPARFLRKIG